MWVSKRTFCILVMITSIPLYPPNGGRSVNRKQHENSGMNQEPTKPETTQQERICNQPPVVELTDLQMIDIVDTSAIVRYTCKDGYRMEYTDPETSILIMCSYGIWDEPKFKCIPKGIDRRSKTAEPMAQSKISWDLFFQYVVTFIVAAGFFLIIICMAALFINFCITLFKKCGYCTKWCEETSPDNSELQEDNSRYRNAAASERIYENAIEMTDFGASTSQASRQLPNFRRCPPPKRANVQIDNKRVVKPVRYQRPLRREDYD